ncbi:hypothetical protein D9615_001963 [Tricholomella constricta]|uniref:Polymerase nucleotidyl transferase domain-containing protein n=1 Tax=Tricholomella constricta TaxID=117010 RepID=A0A8H5HPQ7_9AGAR|nr:hypothetical protein D9615_001963 [Tricholomella constricta]
MSGLKVSQILHSLRPQDAHVSHIYLVGSRLWGTHTEGSDFDLLLVAERLGLETLRSQHKGQYDITLLTKEEFAARVQGGSLIETVCCLLSGDEACVLQEGESMKRLVQDIHVLDAWVTSRHPVDHEKAKKFWLKGKRKDGFKVLQHMITADSVLRGLRKKVQEGRELSSITLTVAELHDFVQGGRDESDWNWLGLEWGEVKEAHAVRLKGAE